MSSDIYITIKAHVVCIDQKTGEEKWRTKLKRYGIMPVVDTGEVIVAYSGGHLFGLDKETGEILWENGLPGLGHGTCLISGDSAQQAAQTAIAAAIAAAQSSSTPGTP